MRIGCFDRAISDACRGDLLTIYLEDTLSLHNTLALTNPRRDGFIFHVAGFDIHDEPSVTRGTRSW